MVTLVAVVVEMAAPSVPALAESLPGYERPPGWFGFFGPAGMQRPIVERLNKAMLASLRTPELKSVLEKNDSVDIGGTPDNLAAIVADTIQLAGEMTKGLGIKPE